MIQDSTPQITHQTTLQITHQTHLSVKLVNPKTVRALPATKVAGKALKAMPWCHEWAAEHPET